MTDNLTETARRFGALPTSHRAHLARILRVLDPGEQVENAVILRRIKERDLIEDLQKLLGLLTSFENDLQGSFEGPPTAVDVLRFLSESREEYGRTGAGLDDLYFQGQINAASVLTEILEGSNSAWGWLPTWRWDEFSRIYQAYRKGVEDHDTEVSRTAAEKSWRDATAAMRAVLDGVAGQIDESVYREMSAAITDWEGSPDGRD